MQGVACADGQLTGSSGTGTSHLLPALTTGKSYYFRVAAYNHDGDAMWSQESYELRTHALPGQTPTPVVSLVTQDSITLQWTTPLTTGTDACDKDLRTDGVSRDIAAETCFSNDDCMRTSAEPCQTVGRGSRVAQYRIKMGGVELTDTQTGLALFPQMTVGNAAETILAESACTDEMCTYTYTVGGLAAANDYDFTVSATNAAGQGAESDSVTGSTLNVPSKPKPPTATQVSTTSITLTWNTVRGYCPEENEPQPSPAYTTAYSAYPATATRTTSCDFDGGVALTGYRIFGSSYNPTALDGDFEGSVHGDGPMYSLEYQQRGYDGTLDSAAVGDWEPARRGSLTDDSDSKTYASAPKTGKPLPSSLDNGKWLELNVGTDTASGTEFTVTHLAQDTYYKFVIVFTNAVGDSEASDESEFFLTLEEPVADLKIHSQPPCIYETSTATRFVATSSGTNVFYKWQLPDGIQYNSHDTRNYGSVIAEGGRNCITSDCSVMEYTLPSISTQTGPSDENKFTIAVVGYNTRGQTVLQTEYNVQYCGCTDPWDSNYWDQATYHMPLMCEYEDWDGADKTAIANEFQHYQLYYKEATHSAQVIVRVDEGEVDLYVSTTQIPDPAMTTTFDHGGSFLAINSFHVMEIDYAELHTLSSARSLYITIRGKETFSRYSVIASTREFSRGRGEQYAAGTHHTSQDYRRMQLLNIEPVSIEVKTPYYDFYEYYFGKASNDVDVEIKVNALLGCVNVYTSKIERYPSAGRASDGYTGYWGGHSGSVCAASGAAQHHTMASASFDGIGGLYGSVSFRQNNDADGNPAGDTTIAVSLKGLAGGAADLDWKINTLAVGAGTGTGCASTGGIFQPQGSTTAADLSVKHGVLPKQTDGLTIHTAAFSDADLSLAGEAISGFEEGTGRDGEEPTADQAAVLAQSILGRSVVITQKCEADDETCEQFCATIFPDSSVTSHVGELRLMHTIKPEEERKLFVSAQGALGYDLGGEQVNNEYVIEAKVYRYRVDSNLLQPATNDEDCFTNAAGDTSCNSDAEDRRYSVVTIDNFNYYEVDVSPAAYGLTIHFTLAYGAAELYTSKNKLPTQDSIGHENAFGDGSVCAAGTCEEELNDGTRQSTDATMFQIGVTYHINIPFSDISKVKEYVFVGVLGTAPDSSYTISVTEYVFTDAMATSLSDQESGCADVAAGSYAFFQLYVGPEDEKMMTTQRSGAGSRTGDLGSDPATWGIDWTEPLTQTWIEQQQDEWDLDVDVNAGSLTATLPDGTTGDGDLDQVTVYGSTREAYPSIERGFDVTGTAAAGVTVPHFTFSDKMVYLSVSSAIAQTICLTATLAEMHVGTLSTDVPTVLQTCPGAVPCSGKGSCVDGTCYCDSTYLGDDCSIEAFSANGPSLTIDAVKFLEPCDQQGTAEDTTDDIGPCGVSTSAFSGEHPVEVPFALALLPPGSKVHIYVDGKPYPAKGANILYYDHPSAQISVPDEKVKIYGMTAGVFHTVELLLLSADNVPLSTDMRDFTVDFHGGCQSDCNQQGICHHGYCVCFDGFVGAACQTEGDVSPDTPGSGYVAYNENQMTHARAEDAYVSQLKMTANTQSLAASDAKITAAHASVVTKLNTFIGDNAQAMASLAAAQEAASDELFRKRDRITTTIQQMREESRRLQTKNQEAYLDTVRTLHEGQRTMQNALDTKRREHFVTMAKQHDEWVEIRAMNDFKLNQLRTANGPLVDIDKLEERVCTQDDMFHTTCSNVGIADGAFETQPGYKTHATVGDIGTCTEVTAATATADATWSDEDGTVHQDSDHGVRCVKGVKVSIDGELDNDMYNLIPR